ncbi:MAG TPA: helix-turn-helix transcriptional regulator [Streptosporangiaceae bacterium]|nr:helix-turn-helix transcriptional regulator [Streptosporangiaceae bacterium]
MARQDLARFLRDRREGLRPAEVGLVAGPRRRTPGLRREEVAELASMSVEYYARLEQARGPRPSPRILDSIASALRMDPVERAHLYGLAGVIPAAPQGPPRRVRPHVARLLERLPETAAIVTAATYDVIAWNPLAEELFGLQGKPNLARRRFLHRDEVLTSGHEDFGEIAVSRLRAAAARYPHDAGLASLVADLRAGSDEFAVIWDTYPVRVPGHRTKSMAHPEVGRLRVSCDVLTVPEDDQQVVFITADPASRSARALRHLASALLPAPPRGTAAIAGTAAILTV